MIYKVEITGNPGIVEIVDKRGEKFRRGPQVIPNVFQGNPDTDFGRDRNQGLDRPDR